MAIVAIAHDPDLYIFDEPFSGLNPINSTNLSGKIYRVGVLKYAKIVSIAEVIRWLSY